MNKTFTVIEKSSNTNSFGYRGLLALAIDGTAREFAVQAYGSDPEPTVGESLDADDPRIYAPLTRALPPVSPERADQILSEIAAEVA